MHGAGIRLQRPFECRHRCILHDRDDQWSPPLDSAFAKAKSTGFLITNWTPQSATRALRWMMQGLCGEWLLFGRRFDLAAEGKDGLKRLFGGFQPNQSGAASLSVSPIDYFVV